MSSGSGVKRNKGALERLKDAVTSTPVLCYYNVGKEVTLQCDESQSGIGAGLMQNGQPMADWSSLKLLTSHWTDFLKAIGPLLHVCSGCFCDYRNAICTSATRKEKPYTLLTH